MVRYTLGIDLGKHALVACLLDEHGHELISPTTFDTTPAGPRPPRAPSSRARDANWPGSSGTKPK